MDTELVRRKLVESRTAAQRAIDSGIVRVGSNPTPKASTMVAPGEPVHLTGPPDQFVSRAGQKLDGALSTFDVSVAGRSAIDVGASTGGFTDCLLQHDALSVIALDVGYGQMNWRIREDDRVTVVERLNIRHADPSALGAPFDMIVADLSFISLRTVATVLAELGNAESDWILLIKPQFEAGKGNVGKGGIVREAAIWSDVLNGVQRGLAEVGLGCQGLAVSSITGTDGNVEFLGHFRLAPARVGDDDTSRVVREAQ